MLWDVDPPYLCMLARLTERPGMMVRRNPLPPIFPEWFQKRAEVDNHRLYEFVEDAAHSIGSSSRVLDAGAGEGKYSRAFAHTNYVAVDLAVGDTDWDYGRLDAVCGLERLPFGQDVFGHVLCTQVLEHVPEPSIVLSELYRVLKANGRLYLSAPQSWHQHQKPYDYYRYTSFGLAYLLRKAGFHVVSIDNMGGYFWFLSFQLQNINYWLFPKGMRGYIFTWPLRLICGLLFQLLLPPVLFYLDCLDHSKDETFGYVCIATKPSV